LECKKKEQVADQTTSRLALELVRMKRMPEKDCTAVTL
jgi:hypothetical protein